MQRAHVAREIERVGVVVIVRIDRAERIVDLARALARGGCSALEVTLTVPGALDAIARLAKEVPELCLGAGTVTTPEQVDEVVQAGATYVVSPIFDVTVIERAHAREVAVAPGCFTPTEMFAAHRAGADFVKLFPAGGHGPRFLKDVLAPLPALPVIPTGGVSVDNAADWIRAGARAVGVGTALVDPRLVQAGAWSELEERARRLVEVVREARDTQPKRD